MRKIYLGMRLCFLVLTLLPIGLWSQGKAPKREFRGVWIATVKNLDWPSKPGLSTEIQQAEFIRLLDFHKANGMNAVVVQVRPAGDAMYFSPTEPWSEWLTGQQGKAPDPWYDPLAFMIEAAHERGLEFHAWLNPFRALTDVQRNKLLSVNHISVKRSDWTLQYGSNLYIDPGIPKARNYVTEVVSDIVKRYDIDAIHFDDYFYPYRIQGQAFPDTLSFELYGKRFRNKDAWRRSNIDNFIRSVNMRIRMLKPHVKFGISPFGVWRNRDRDATGSNTRAGQTSYDDLYADTRKWLQRGWIDYIAPQIYWSIGFPPADYETLLKWWSENSAGKHLYIGKATYKIANNSDKRWMDPEQTPRQINMARRTVGVDGSIHFRAKTFFDNPLGINDSLRNHYYQYPALIPEMDWLAGKKPQKPVIQDIVPTKKGLMITWKAEATDKIIIYRFPGEYARDVEDPASIVAILNKGEQVFFDTDIRQKGKFSYVLTSLNRMNLESDRSDTYFIKIRGKDLKKMLTNK